jgi:2-amino-4-hydroxy-6-hydroxymethyldihydropteridine diphosphokinase
MAKAYIGLGSNLDNPILHIKTAIQELSIMPQSTLMKVSSLYRNPPIGFLDQPDFINAVVEVDTNLSADELLKTLISIENDHQRIRNHKNGPRTLDLDLLLYGDLIKTSSSLIVPHPRLKERSFVVCPLFEIAPHLMLPCGMKVKNLLKMVNVGNLDVVDEVAVKTIFDEREKK